MWTVSPMWIVITVIAALGLVFFSSDKSGPVRGSLSLGILAGLIVATVYFFVGYDFQIQIVGKWIVAVIAVVSVQEALRRFRKRSHRR